MLVYQCDVSVLLNYRGIRVFTKALHAGFLQGDISALISYSGFLD